MVLRTCVVLMVRWSVMLMGLRGSDRVMRRGARKLNGGGKPLQGQRDHDKPKQQCLEPAIHGGEL
ncbi:MAG: hypothetical protein JWP36_156 [Paucimonas sp.]|nr:hypothetical protein [Paucimonas sp.]